jgi:hypothetical protein
VSCKYLVLLVLVFAGIAKTTAQSLVHQDFVSGELIVMLQRGASISAVCEAVSSKVSNPISPKKVLSEGLNIWLVEFDPEIISMEDAKSIIDRNGDVRIVQLNHTHLMIRSEPNDSLFSKQWSFLNDGTNGGSGLADADATAAWDITTGGLTPNGDTIVVAVIDQGFEITHVDLTENWFRNRLEIADNNLDDDGNGYVDDIMGWNVYSSTGTHFTDLHGTHVSGIVGARGDNHIGVTGVNWNVKILPVSGSSSLESTVVEAYAYVLEMRKMYNETNGASGAFVVSANSSFGVDYGQPEDFPIWCAMFDSLGEAGVLSVGATANENVNVDVDGDIPTACSSDFLVTVTNTNSNDQLQNGSGFGLQTIDLGAPGESIYSTVTNNFYGKKSGTSMAAPHVAGTIGLMYSAICPDVLNSFHHDPAGLALYVKKQLMDSGTKPLEVLNGKVKTGGRLDVYEAVKSVSDHCLQIKLVGFDSDCDSCNGAVSAEILGESGQVEFIWSNGQTGADIQDLCPGVYSVTAIDEDGDSVSSSIAISDSLGPEVEVQIVNPSCAGNSDGSVMVLGAVNYEWIDGFTGANRTDLNEGKYYLLATDSNANCTTVVSVNLIAPDSLRVEYKETLPTTELGSDGKIDAKPKGGIFPYAYLWKNGATTSTLSNIARGQYAITITDSKGCVFTDTAHLGWTLGVQSDKKIAEDYWRFFPNPAYDLVVLESGTLIQNVVVLDAAGKVVSSLDHVNYYRQSISVLNLLSGFYYFEVKCLGSTHRGKLLVSHE